jgi:hypothetical protein
MPVLVEARGFGSAETHLFEGSRRCVSCGVRERNNQLFGSAREAVNWRCIGRLGSK